MRKIGKDWKDDVVCCLGTAVHFGVLWEMGLRGGGAMMRAVSTEVWVMRLIMETMLSPVSSNHLLGSWTMPLGLSVLMW